MSNISIFLSPTKTCFLPHLCDEKPFNVGVVNDNKKTAAREKKHVLMKKFILTSCLPVESVVEKNFSYEQYSASSLQNQAENDPLSEKEFFGPFRENIY